MMGFKKNYWISLIGIYLLSFGVSAQETVVHGFVTTQASYDVDNDQFSFGIGNQSTVVTGNISDKISFLGESIFAIVGNKSPTGFSVYLDRVQVKYNYWGNHDVLIGKIHTPVNYWNCLNSCHAMLFYPTISRPKLFTYQIVPLHETGISFRGEYLTNINLGYDITIGNGIGATWKEDNDQTKSLLISGHMSPIQGFRFGLSYYKDRIAPGKFGAVPLGTMADNGILLKYAVDYNIFSGSLAYFKGKIEFLSEFSFSTAIQDTALGEKEIALGYFGYAGYKFGKIIPYLRFDYLNFDANEVYFNAADQAGFALGCRYEINHLAILKLEYELDNIEIQDREQTNKIYFQIAIGF